ncbi:hypothetical protein F4821DRAFT_248096 [Hypoxylon rubiginosum]|uniref:Uncharacterized protein n=1 Tax=Hypoxylon rubiginosum TaxID=110542 RepID=A0ACC0CNS9_9PEZI|nr:hypothetical protein F4821DRAFT_248096 [Hypoxylon rubiginosum]
MKYTTAAALLPLASAANIDTRQTNDLKYEISDFTAACTVESVYCFYGISIVTSNNPDFKQSCDAMGTSDSGELPAVGETQCGTYTVSVAKSDGGGLVLTVSSRTPRLTGTHAISSGDLTTTTSGGKSVQSYTGDSSFTIDAGSASSAPTSTSGTAASTPVTSSVSSTASSVSPNTTPEPSTTGTTTSSSAGPSETNGATRVSAFGGVSFAVGLMAFIF